MTAEARSGSVGARGASLFATVLARPSGVVAALLFALCLVRLVRFALAPDALLISILPDDAFYYMKLAAHRVHDGVWSFDGETPASGFHPLYAHLLALLYALFGELSWRTLFLIVGACSTVTIPISAWALVRVCETVFSRRAALFAAAPFVTGMALLQPTIMMESWLALAASAGTLFAVARIGRVSRRAMLGLFALGVFGSLSRSDYGMLPGVLFVVLLAYYRSVRAVSVQRAGLVLAGAVAGVALVIAQTWSISGHLLQASARVKLHWSVVNNHDLRSVLDFYVGCILPLFSEAPVTLKPSIRNGLTVVVIAAFAGTLLARRRLWPKQGEGSAHGLPLWLGGLAVFAAYGVFYRYDSAALQNWYCANLIVPAGLSLAGAAYALPLATSLAPRLAALAWMGASVWINLLQTPWPHTAGMMNAGLYLRSQPPNIRYGAWNAGILSYFSQRKIINIDGLVNDAAVPYILGDRLVDYLADDRIDYVADYPAMVDIPLVRRRGGYDNPATERCLGAVGPIDGNAPPWIGGRLLLYRVTPNCH